jgi:chromosome segregation ATPase
LFWSIFCFREGKIVAMVVHAAKSEDVEDEIDIIEFLEKKGIALDPFKREFVDLQKNLDYLNASNTGKEREMDMKSAELRILREQLNFTKRNIDELLSQQEVLKDTIDNANTKKEGLITRETEQRNEISIYSSYFGELKEALGVGADWSAEQIEQRLALEKEREFMTSKLENKNNQLQAARSEVEHAIEQMKFLETEIEGLDKKIEEVNSKKTDIKKESQRLANRKENIEKEIFNMRTSYVDKEKDLNEKLKLFKIEEKEIKHLDTSIQKTKTQMELYISNYEKLYYKLNELTHDLEKQNNNNAKLENEMKEKHHQISEVDSEIKKIKKLIQQKVDLKNLVNEKIADIDKLKGHSEGKIEDLNKQINETHNVEHPVIFREIEHMEKSIGKYKQELEIFRKKQNSSERSSKAITDLIILNKNGKLNLSIEIKILEEDIEHYQSNIRLLLSEKEKYERETEIANQQYYTSLEELKLQEMQVHELNKKIIHDQMKLKQKQSLYESVRSDRNLFSKQLLDSQDEISTLKKKFKSMNHLIDQMKEDISSKDHAIVKEHFLHHSVDKERELLKNELTKIKKQVQASEGIIENQRVEIMKLQRIIEEAEQERQRQKNELSSVLSERNLLTGQLVKRNEELNVMYEKIKTQRGDLKMGELSYYKFTQEIGNWQSLIRNLVEKNNETISNLSDFEVLENEIISLEKDIRKEKIRARALMDELETPMNVHRWRILESSDPKRYDKILQIQSLQKQLIVMSDKIIQNDLLIQEKEKIYVELKNVISRQPGPEIEEQILLYQQTLKDKQKQLLSMNSELEMYIEQVKRFKDEIGDYDNHLLKINKNWVKQTQKRGGTNKTHNPNDTSMNYNNNNTDLNMME